LGAFHNIHKEHNEGNIFIIVIEVAVMYHHLPTLWSLIIFIHLVPLREMLLIVFEEVNEKEKGNILLVNAIADAYENKKEKLDLGMRSNATYIMC
jgi:hypothetical protein